MSNEIHEARNRHKMETLYVTFRVEVSDTEYYGGKRGEAETKIRVPRIVLASLDSSSLFVSSLEAALADFDTDEEETE